MQYSVPVAITRVSITTKEEGGPRGTLIITEDSDDGGIDSAAVSHLIDDLF